MLRVRTSAKVRRNCRSQHTFPDQVLRDEAEVARGVLIEAGAEVASAILMRVDIEKTSTLWTITEIEMINM